MRKNIGTLVPISALSSSQLPKNENGTFATALIFLDWLKKTQQSVWQMLPIHQTQLELGSSSKHVPSPYKSYGVGLDPKYLSLRFNSTLPTPAEKNDFLETNSDWIHDYALFCALRDYFKTDDWSNWHQELRKREPNALSQWSKKLAKEIDNHIIVQWQLHRAYFQLRNKAKKLDISLSGDLPFYVSFQSPLVWAHQSVFALQNDGSMQHVSGIPNINPSFFGRQIWGHPLYNWELKENSENMRVFWEMRLRYMANLFDIVRFDHVKAFYEYGVIDLEDEQHDGYKKGPGSIFFEKLITFSKQCGLSLYVEEDSDNKIQAMTESLKILKTPSIIVFRFGLDEKKDIVIGEYADVLHYPESSVVYTTTHDTETLMGYLHNLTAKQKKRLAIAANVEYNPMDRTFAKILRDAILASPSHMVIIPIQDWLLTTERINLPGTELPINDPNWNFQVKIPIEDLPIHF